MDNKQLHVLYEGHVQGVGFRYSAQHIAQTYAVTGYVRNLADGRVEVVAEGEENEVERFIEHIKTSPLRDYIQNSVQVWRAPLGTYKRFNIAF